MKTGLVQANGMLKRLKNVDRRGMRPVDIVFYTANNLQNYSYQVNRIGVFKFASFLIYIHFLSTAILYSFKALLCSETPQDSIAANEELLSGVAELKTSLLITLMSPLFEMSCITNFPVTPHEFPLQKVHVLAEKIPHNLDFGHHLLSSTPQSSHGQHPVIAS
jgi:hypothetical protein